MAADSLPDTTLAADVFALDLRSIETCTNMRLLKPEGLSQFAGSAAWTPTDSDGMVALSTQVSGEPEPAAVTATDGASAPRGALRRG
jgi:hypothetical protein